MLLFLAQTLKVLGTNYYVRNGGNDSNDGLSDSNAWASHPWMSTWKGSIWLKAGDTIFMKRGDFWIISETSVPFLTIDQSGTEGKNIVTTSYGTGESPLIKISTASDQPVIYASGKSYLTFDNLHIQHHSNIFASSRSGFEFANVCHHIVITNNEIDNCPAFGIHGSGNCYQIVIGDTTANQTATSSDYSNHIHDFGYAGVGLEGVNPIDRESNFYVYHNYIHDSSPDKFGDLAYGIYFSAMSGSSAAWPKYAYARFNRVENIRSWEGIDMHGGSYIYIQDNYIRNFGKFGIAIIADTRRSITPLSDHIYTERNILEQPSSGWLRSAQGSFITQFFEYQTSYASNIFIRDNTIYFTNQPDSSSYTGISIQNIDGIIVSGNRIYNGSVYTGKPAISFPPSDLFGIKNAIIKNNYIYKWGPGILFDGSSITGSLEIFYNIIALPSNQACIRNYNSNISVTGEIIIYNNILLADNYLYCFQSSQGIDPGGTVIAKNNIFGRETYGPVYYWSWQGNISGKFICDCNLYWNSSINKPFWYNTESRSWIYWTSSLGFDTHSIFNTDPNLYNFSGSFSQEIDFILHSTSPAIDAGTTVGLLTDYSGTPISGIPDIGVFEGNAASNPPTYLSSVIENSSPSILEITYNLTLEKIIPAVDAFTVLVDGVKRNVTTLTINENKVRLLLSSPVLFGDKVTLSYKKPVINWLRSILGGEAQDIIDQPVINNCRDPSLPNKLPVININFQPTAFSGFVYALDASGSSDGDNDKLTFLWSAPQNVPISSLTGPLIKFLTPVVTKSEILTFTLKVTDGTDTVSHNFEISLLPFKPLLSLSKVSVIEASDYYLTNYPNNVADGDLSTLWSINGDNHWLNISLQEPYEISYIQIALLPGQTYESYFDIYASKDNVFWEPIIINAASCGFSGALQNFEFPPEKTGNEYLYVKLVGHGTSINSLNNYSEVKIFGQHSSGHSSGDHNISFYPNPVTDNINILILEPPSESLILRVFDFSGRLCMETLLDPLINNIQVPVGLPAGPYIVQILFRNIIVFSEKIVVSR